MARLSLFSFPLSPTGEGGLHQVMAEVARVLKPGGMFYALTRRGEGLSFYFMSQLLNLESINRLAEETGLIQNGYQEHDLNKTLNTDSPLTKSHPTVTDTLSFQLIKPLDWQSNN